MDYKKVIACDLDGTLAESKSMISKEMVLIICEILLKYKMAVISGGSYKQYQKQFLSQISCTDDRLSNLFLFPTNGSTCYSYQNGEWKQVYNEPLSPSERDAIISALNFAIKELNMDLSGAYGEIIEDRGSQVTFSGKGQEAPYDVKKSWDPDRLKREKIVEIIKKMIPNFEIRVNSTSSIDITKPGIDKAYAIGKIKDLLKVEDSDIIFVGDAMYEHGNDSPVKKTGVDYIQESGPHETGEFLKRYL